MTFGECSGAFIAVGNGGMPWHAGTFADLYCEPGLTVNFLRNVSRPLRVNRLTKKELQILANNQIIILQ